ncbi:MAG TPA: hypothetical protein VF125_12925 [Solirubrobacterales bacterium]
MNFLRKLALTAFGTSVLIAISSTAASATTLEVGGVKQNGAVLVEASLTSGTSMTIKDTNNVLVDTCTGSSLKGTTGSPFTGSTVTAALSTLSFTSCSHKTTVLKAGTLHFTWSSGTNATVSSSGAEITIETTAFGISAICKTGTGTNLGTLTGKASDHAIIDINAVLKCGLADTKVWTATYTVTSPTGLGVVS